MYLSVSYPPALNAQPVQALKVPVIPRVGRVNISVKHGPQPKRPKFNCIVQNKGNLTQCIILKFTLYTQVYDRVKNSCVTDFVMFSFHLLGD